MMITTNFNPITSENCNRIPTWQEFLEISRAYGFKCGFCHKFIGTGWSDKKGFEEEEIIFFHEEKGLILYAESFEKNRINSAIVYGEVKLNEAVEEDQWDTLHSLYCSCGYNKNGTIHFSVDVRENLRFTLDEISKTFEFSTKWTRVPYLNFSNYMEDNNKDITDKKINACTPDVQKIIFGKC